MAEITRRRTGEFLRELFNILMASPDGMQASEAIQTLAGRFTLSAYEADTYESGGRRFDKIVRFATVDCVKAGWLLKDKGIWTITDEGRKAHAELADPEPDDLVGVLKRAEPVSNRTQRTRIELFDTQNGDLFIRLRREPRFEIEIDFTAAQD